MEDELIYKVLNCAYEVHGQLGPGLLESAYQSCLCHELQLRSFEFSSEVKLPVFYKGLLVDQGYRLDIVIENKLVLELKAVETILPVHKAQLITYLKLGNYPMGLLINFCVPSLKDGISRVYPNTKKLL